METPRNLGGADPVTGSAVPFILIKNTLNLTQSTDYEVLRPRGRQLRVLTWWTTARDTTASTITLKNGASTIGTAAKGTADNARVNGTVDNTYEYVAADTAIYVNLSAAADCDVVILAYWAKG